MNRLFPALRVLRRYLVAVAILVVLLVKIVAVTVTEEGPYPQHPPIGMKIHRNRVQLEWRPGEPDGPVRLLVSKNDPEFKKTFVDKKIKSNRFDVRDLDPGSTYYWKLEKGEKESPTAWFETARSALRYQ